MNCILVSKDGKSSPPEKYVFTGLSNKTNIECLTIRQNLKPGNYWVTIGLKESDNYLDFGKTSIVLYDRINITSVEPQFILSRSSDANIEVYGNFKGLMDYYAIKASFDRIKVNFTGVTSGRRQPQYFDVFSISSESLTIKLGNMKNLTLEKVPFKSKLSLFDLETNK